MRNPMMNGHGWYNLLSLPVERNPKTFKLLESFVGVACAAQWQQPGVITTLHQLRYGWEYLSFGFMAVRNEK